MNQFNDREKAEERKFANSAEMEFKIAAKRNRLLGAWAAGLMGLGEDATAEYAASVVVADLKEAGDEDVISKVYNDLVAAKVDVTEHTVRRELERFGAEARQSIAS